ncbi:minichromosome maintenance- protein [Nowakowskiella sp. JEL0078]|nr:minichromosome maintenance- protein [Nowakowskiella sp. JEL0078]
MVPLCSIEKVMQNGDIAGDWITIGIISEKSNPKTGRGNCSYIVLHLSDLKGFDLRLILLGDCYEKHWKELVGSIVAILNPKILPKRNNSMAITLDHSHKFIKIGMSVDMKFCKFTGNGKQCRKVVDMYVKNHLENVSNLYVIKI